MGIGEKRAALRLRRRCDLVRQQDDFHTTDGGKWGLTPWALSSVLATVSYHTNSCQDCWGNWGAGDGLSSPDNWVNAGNIEPKSQKFSDGHTLRQWHWSRDKVGIFSSTSAWTLSWASLLYFWGCLDTQLAEWSISILAIANWKAWSILRSHSRQTMSYISTMSYSIGTIWNDCPELKYMLIPSGVNPMGLSFGRMGALLK